MAPGSPATFSSGEAPIPQKPQWFLDLVILSPVIAHIPLKCSIAMHDRCAPSVPGGQVLQLLMLSYEHGNLLVSGFSAFTYLQRQLVVSSHSVL